MKLNIGTIIRDRRRAMDMTQEQLAERLGVTCQSVSRWENCMTYPDIEFLPVLADLFGITLDELMGHTKTAKEQRLAKLWEEYEAIDDDDLEAGFDHLARMREEYPNEWDAAHEMVRLAAWYNIRKDKLHALTMEVLENCADEEIRQDVTEIYLSTADEEAIDRPFLDKYTRVVDRFYLLEQRYFRREDWDRYEEVRQYVLTQQLHLLFGERLRRKHHAAVEDSVWAWQTGFGIINLLTGYRASNSGKLADIVDPTPDMWFDDKFWMGMRLSAALASSDRCADALDVLEKTVTLVENTFTLPVGTLLTYRSPVLDCINGEILPQREMSNDSERWSVVCYKTIIGKNGVDSGANGVEWLYRNDEGYWSLVIHVLTERDGWEWFDPIREHSRYLACIDRMNALRETVST